MIKSNIVFFMRLIPTITVHARFKQDGFLLSSIHKTALSAASPQALHTPQLHRYILPVTGLHARPDRTHVLSGLLMRLVHHFWSAELTSSSPI
jgi:hypothetical protein